ncbi:aspartyl/asparaginyl beta-hydroxylase domain-containing protein [Cryptosporangium sp. NPDC051539]|uniref:aspartyl/asparaginyl beta-hydroxylase domain-containing protein n=1 Tax=Cryptosporangium sp. NPDC051539 TaxID=3363962 RepID=UPI0037A583D3
MTDPFAGLPAAVRLQRDFDPGRLRADLDRLTLDRWRHQRTYADDGSSTEYRADWRVLPLRSQGGDAHRTDAGGPGPAPFRSTRWLDEASYLGEILASLPSGLRAARLMSLAPGASVETHRDTPLGPAVGMVRLHVPLITNDGAVLILDGEKHCWQPGEFWYGDFSRPHSIANTGTADRVHLVLDTALHPDLFALFPPEFTDRLSHADVLYERPERPLNHWEQASFRGDVDVPGPFVRWSGEPLDDTVGGPDEQRWSILTADDGLFLTGGPAPIGLRHLGAGEFRLQGWTDERTLHIDRTAASVRFTIRTGSSTRTEERPLLPAV